MMDKKTFDKICKQIHSGNFNPDAEILGYGLDSIFEMQQLLSALWSCCLWQTQKIEILTKLYQAANKKNGKLVADNNELKEQVENMDGLLMAKDNG